MRWDKNPYPPNFPYMPPGMEDFYKQYKSMRKLNKLIAREKEEEKKASEEKKKKEEKKHPGMSTAQVFMLLSFGGPLVGIFQLYLLALALTQMSEAIKLILK